MLATVSANEDEYINTAHGTLTAEMAITESSQGFRSYFSTMAFHPALLLTGNHVAQRSVSQLIPAFRGLALNRRFDFVRLIVSQLGRRRW